MVLSLSLTRCAGLPQDMKRCGLELIRLLKHGGVVFLPLSCSPEIDPHPERRVGASGRISELVGVEHPLLGKGLGHDASGRPRVYGSANMTFTGPDGSVRFAQGTDCNDPATWPVLAESLWRFATLIQPSLKPDYAHLDHLGRDNWTDVWELELKYLFWKNLFGPRYVEKYGRDFFLGAPGVSIELGDGSIQCSPEPLFLDWVSKPASPIVKDAVKYFRQKFPKIRPYHGKPLKLPYEVLRIIAKDETGAERILYKRAKELDAEGEAMREGANRARHTPRGRDPSEM